MFHKLLSTDGPGSECIRCGQAFDGEGEALSDVESLVPCTPSDGPTHHWVAEGMPGEVSAACHYCSEIVTDVTLPADVPTVCAER